MKKKGIVLVKALISVGLLVYFFSRVGVKEIYQSILAIPFSLWALCFLLLIGANIFMAFRWCLIVRHLGLELSIQRCQRLYFLGLFFNNFLPSGVGGDFVKAYYLAQDTHSYERPFLSIFLDRYIGLHVMLFSAVVFSAVLKISVEGELLFPYLLAVMGGVMVLNALMLSRFSRQLIDLVERRIPRIEGKLEVIYQGVGQVVKDRRLFFFFALLSAGYILFTGGIHHLILAQEGFSLGIIQSTTVLILVNCAIFLPISIGGIGIREGLYLYLYSSCGVALPQILALSSIYLTLILACSLIGLPFFLVERQNIIPEKTRATEFEAG
jgi:uncharacterized protein (TIRG00374 family)